MRSVDDTARLRLLNDLGRAFAARIEIDHLVPFVIRQSRDVLNAGGASVLLLDDERREFYFPYVAEDDAAVAEALLALRFPADRGIAGVVLETGRSLRIDDAQRDERFYAGVDERTGIVTRNVLAAPLASHHGTIGVLQVINHQASGPFSDDDLALIEALAGSVAVALENARLYAHMKASAERLQTEVGALRRDVARSQLFSEIVGTGEAMAEIFRLMESAASAPIAVLIEGETGTGKELVARMVHRASPRAEASFLAVNCAALPETLLESELFGHKRGAFTGAVQDRRGLFEAADGGTIFLDEIGEMPAPMQPKLLRVLQEGEVTPLGETRPRKVDVRLVSATNRDLEAAMQEGAFREDLYYRVAAFPIRLPPLRERREDIPLLVDRFLGVALARQKKEVPGIDGAALECFTRFDWPGNVRELQNEIERAVALVPAGELITCRQLSAKLLPRDRPVTPAVEGAVMAAVGAEASPGAKMSLRQARRAFEVRFIGEVLRQHDGNVSRAAEALGLSRVALQKKMKEHGLRDP